MLLGSSPLCPPRPLGALAALAFWHKAGSRLLFSEEDDERVARTLGARRTWDVRAVTAKTVAGHFLSVDTQWTIFIFAKVYGIFLKKENK